MRPALALAILVGSGCLTPRSTVLAQTAAPTTTPAARSGADMEDASAVRGGFIIPLLALLAVIAGILVLIDDGGDAPVSP